jgi:hypothetical protein
MLNQLFRNAMSLAVAAAVALPLVGCGKKEAAVAPPPPYEGRYKNASGAVVLEIKEGRVIFTNPATREKTDTSFSGGPDNMMVESGAGIFNLKFAPPDTITGLPPAIAGGAGPLKKAS